jgi:diadenosine tetraphosphate (Ap4A) HIT family hydrolase
MDCIFCKIINNEIPARKIYEDDFVLAFLDINPAAAGHALVIPKKHFDDIFEIDSEYLMKIISASQKISQKMKDSLGVTGVNLYHASGRSAEQSVFHFHLHIIPRVESDGIDFTGVMTDSLKKIDSEELEAIRKKITLI